MSQKLLVLLALVMVGCESKPATPSSVPSVPKPRMSATEIFNLRTKCQELTEKWQEEGVLGLTGAALTSEVEPHYDPVTNHCYVKVTVTKNFNYVDKRPAKDRVPNDYLTVTLSDAQTKKQLLFASQQNGSRTALDERKEESIDASYDGVKAEIDKLMSEE